MSTRERQVKPEGRLQRGVRFCDLSVHGFRAFGDFCVSGFRAVNLFVGRNNVGKTSLLEAIWCLSGPQNSMLPLKINLMRGLNTYEQRGEDVWGWVFHEHRVGEPIVLEGTLACPTGRRRTASYRLQAEPLVQAAPPSDAPESIGDGVSSTAGQPSRDSLIVTYSLVGEQSHTAKAHVTPDAIEGTGGEEKPTFDAVLMTPLHRNVQDDVGRLSRIEEVRKKELLLNLLRHVEPRLRDISIGTVGGRPIPRADIGIGRLIPLVLVGQGVYRLFQFAAAVIANAAGIVLIDEAENGLHYESLQDVWKGLRTLANESDVQLFVTTHSRECVQAAYEAFRHDNAEDLAVYRLERVESAVRAVPFTPDAMEEAFASGLEVR